MRFTAQVKVMGMKASKGTLENGASYDSTKVYVEASLDDSKGNAKGFSVIEHSFGNSSEYDKYKHLTFPFPAEATFEIATTGKAQRTLLIELRPVDIPNKQKTAA